MSYAVTTGLAEWSESERHRGVRFTALVALYALAAGAVWSPPIAQLAQAALFVILVIQVCAHPRAFARSAMFWVTVGFVLYVMIRAWFAGVVESPDLSGLHFEGMRRWIKAGPLPVLYVAVAFALIGDRRVHIRRIFAVFVIVFTIQLLVNLEPGRLWAALNSGRRYIFGLHFAFTSLLYVLVITGLLTLGVGACLEYRRHRAWCTVSGAICGVLLVFFLMTLIAGGARTSWIAALAGVTVMGLCLAVHARGRLLEIVLHWHRAAALVVVGLVLFVGLFGYVFGGTIADRFSKFGNGPTAAIEVVMGERAVESLPRGSVSARVAYYAFGMERLGDRPLVGYGPGRPRHLVFQYEAPEQINNRQTHLHSQYVDVLLRFGLIGFVLLISVFVFAFRGAVIGWSRRQIGSDYLLFMIGALTVYAVWSLSDQRFSNYTMIAVVSLILGSGVSFLFSGVVNRRPERRIDSRSRQHSSPTAEEDK